MDEIRRIADRVTVLRDGRVVDDAAVGGRVDGRDGRADGRRSPGVRPSAAGAAAGGEVALRVRGPDCAATRVRDVSFEVRRGEILGLAGLVGSGRTETLRAIFGADRADAGEVRRGDGPPLADSLAARRRARRHRPDPRGSAGAGAAPAAAGAHEPDAGVARRLHAAAGWIDATRENAAAAGVRERLDVRTRGLEQPVAELSGGNQQKVVIARWLLRDCDVLLVDEPTRGIDVAAKAGVHRRSPTWRRTGHALVVVSSELDELMAICDRIAVLSAGRLVATFARDAFDEEALLAAAFSGVRPMTRLRDYVGLAVVLALLVALFSLLSDHFFSRLTFTTLANQVPALTVVAVGMTLVLIAAGIDLSVGSVLALAGAVMALARVEWDWPLPVAVAAALGVGSTAGLLNGLVTVRWAMPSFIVTLGMLEIARGATYLVTDSRSVYVGGAVDALGTPIAGLGLSPAFLAGGAGGRRRCSSSCPGPCSGGTSSRSAPTTRRCGSRASIRGRSSSPCSRWPACSPAWAASSSSRYLESADPNAGIGLELSAIAAVVIGGTSLMGGRGSVVASFLGVLIIAVLQAGLAQIGATEPAKRIVTGLVIVAAVILDAHRRSILVSRGLS